MTGAETVIAVVALAALGIAALAFFAWDARHVHQWGESVKIAEAAPARVGDGDFNGPADVVVDVATRAYHGSVTYEQRCARCGKTRTYEVLGSEAADD